MNEIVFESSDASMLVALLLIILIFWSDYRYKGALYGNTDIPQFHTYRGEIEFEGTLIQADIFIDNKMLEDKNSFLISFLCKSNTIYKIVCRSVLKKEGYYINLKFNGVKLKTRVLSVSQSFIDSNSEIYRIGLMCSNDLSI